jgi:hypothetical protein
VEPRVLRIVRDPQPSLLFPQEYTAGRDVVQAEDRVVRAGERIAVGIGPPFINSFVLCRELWYTVTKGRWSVGTLERLRVTHA